MVILIGDTPWATWSSGLTVYRILIRIMCNISKKYNRNQISKNVDALRGEIELLVSRGWNKNQGKCIFIYARVYIYAKYQETRERAVINVRDNLTVP